MRVEDGLVHEIAGDAQFRISREMAPLPPALDAEVDRLWDAAQRRMNGALFNGRVFSADEITPHLVCGHWSEYRRIVAQMERPALYARLGVRSLAVGGVIEGPDGIVFGRRPAGAIYQAGEWQLPPAGSVDPGVAGPADSVDVVGQLFVELREELGLAADSVRGPRLLCIIEHAASHVLDLGIAMRTELTAAQIHAAHIRGGNGEYDPLEVVAPEALAAFLARESRRVNLQAPVFLRRMGLLAN
jgi:hypothetical protein